MEGSIQQKSAHIEDLLPFLAKKKKIMVGILYQV